MTEFQQRELKRGKTLGERLRKVREEAGITLEEVEQRIHVRRKYLEALENGDYLHLPSHTYVKNFLKAYALFLHVSPQVVTDLYDREHAILEPLAKRKLAESQVKYPKTKALVSPRGIRYVLLALVALIIIGYLGLELTNTFSAPALEIVEPSEGSVTSDRSVDIVGRTDPLANVMINGQEVFLDQGGIFRQTVELQIGLNVITIAAKKERGKESTVVRHIRVDPAPLFPSRPNTESN